MKFIEKYPSMKAVAEVKDCIMRGGTSPCAICGDLTEFVEINYEAHICSDECLDKMEADKELARNTEDERCQI